MRRSNVLTGAEWIQTRFGAARGATLAHLSVVVFALINVIGLLAYAFKGIGKFAAIMLPWHFTGAAPACSATTTSTRSFYGLTSLYAIKGGMISVVITEIMQFTVLTADGNHHRSDCHRNGFAGDRLRTTSRPAG